MQFESFWVRDLIIDSNDLSDPRVLQLLKKKGITFDLTGDTLFLEKMVPAHYHQVQIERELFTEVANLISAVKREDPNVLNQLLKPIPVESLDPLKSLDPEYTLKDIYDDVPWSELYNSFIKYASAPFYAFGLFCVTRFALEQVCTHVLCESENASIKIESKDKASNIQNAIQICSEIFAASIVYDAWRDDGLAVNDVIESVSKFTPFLLAGVAVYCIYERADAIYQFLNFDSNAESQAVNESLANMEDIQDADQTTENIVTIQEPHSYADDNSLGKPKNRPRL